MAIKIELNRKAMFPDLSREVAIRIDIGLFVIQEYISYFEPRKLVVWLNAPVEELGGEKFKEKDLFQVSNAREIYPEIAELYKELGKKPGAIANSIIRIEGKWKLGDVEVEGFFSINHDDSWKGAYGDIDIDGYPTGKYDDFLDMFWEKNNIRDEIVNIMFENFVKRYKSKKDFVETFDLHWICFADGIPSKTEVPSMRAVYYDNDKELLKDVFKTYNDRHKNEVRKSISRNYLINKSFGFKLFQAEMRGMAAICQVSRLEGGSIMLVGKKSDSFKELYEKFATRFLKPIYQELPHDSEVDAVLSRVIRMNSSLKDVSFDETNSDDEKPSNDDE